MQKIFIVIGLCFLIIGILLPWLLKSGIGHFPGDFIIKRNNTIFYFPLTTCLLISFILSILFWLFNK